MRKKRNHSPKIKRINPEDLSGLLDRARNNTLSPEDCEIIRSMAETIEFIIDKLNQKDVRLKQMLKQILGIKSEKSSKVVKQNTSENSDPAEKSNDASPSSDGPTPPKSKGHGRNGAEKYTGAARVCVLHKTLKPGDSCPECLIGKVYKEKKPGVFIYIEGKPPIQATVYETEKLRCNLCGEIFEANLPIQAPDNTRKHYDETARSMMAILRYGNGLPLNRLENLQADLGIPLPATTAWEKTQEAAQSMFPVHEELKRLGAQGDIIHNDDTGMKILEVMQDIEDELKKANGKKIRTGIFTTGIVSVVGDKKIALFFTGRKHAGENFDDLLKQREFDRSPPLQMCDAKTGNTLESTSAIVCNCNTHARRYFVNVSENFPDECTYVILDVYKEIYKNDAYAKMHVMTSEQRLQYHQANSGPIMDKFHLWLNRQFDEKRVEPNSELGLAISYVLNHWPELTRFLHVPGAALDNNICEQLLKTAIYHRKNSLFYKTANGARVGDMFMSLIHTCHYAGANPFDYLTQLQKNASAVVKEPSKWLPWNYCQALENLNSVFSARLD